MKKIIYMLFIAMCFTAVSYGQINFDTTAVIKNNRELYAIVVSQNNKVVCNKYFNGKSDTTLFNSQSLTKSVVSLLIGIAIDKGYIKSADEKIVKYFPVLASGTDRRKGQITIRQVMNQASGLWHEDLGMNGNLGMYLSLPNPSGYVISAPLGSEPGKVFHYSNAASHLLSVIITRSTGMSTLAFAEKYLFKPLQITKVQWDKMNDGYYDGCGLKSVQMNTADMNKIGSLLLNGGDYNNKSIVPEKWIAQLLRPAVFYNTDWGFPGSTYALCYYHYNYKGTPVTYGLGWGGQFVFVIPEKKAVITVNENIADVTAIKASNLFLEKIFPLIYKQLK